MVVTFRVEIDVDIPHASVTDFLSQVGRGINLKEVVLPEVYEKPIDADERKKADLFSLCKFLPYDRREFY